MLELNGMKRFRAYVTPSTQPNLLIMLPMSRVFVPPTTVSAKSGPVRSSNELFRIKRFGTAESILMPSARMEFAASP